jgi:hypothetical protein
MSYGVRSTTLPGPYVHLGDQLVTVDMALRAEGAPSGMSMTGRINWIGDQRRIAERNALDLERRLSDMSDHYMATLQVLRDITGVAETILYNHDHYEIGGELS